MKSILIGNRIPKEFFITKGTGESNIQVHAGSYHLALKEAGIESYNIMTYSSILPSIAKEVKQPKKLPHGCVLETIMATANSSKGKRATAAIIFGWLYDRKTNKKYGGLVCEYKGNKTEKAAGESLKLSLQELYTNGFEETCILKDTTLLTTSFTPKKKFGTALVALCFTSYEIPLIKR